MCKTWNCRKDLKILVGYIFCMIFPFTALPFLYISMVGVHGFRVSVNPEPLNP
jgi:hypothetical protein